MPINSDRYCCTTTFEEIVLIKRSIRWAFPAIVACLLTLLFISPVLAAIAQPDNLSIEGIWVYENCRVNGDQLYLILEDIDYSVTGEPSDGADETYMVRLMDGGDTLQYTYPVAYHNDGYDMGVVALYFSPGDAPTWEGLYTLELLGNPFQDWEGGVPSESVTSPDFDLWQTADITTIKTLVASRIIWLANELEDDWGDDMVTTSDTGEDVLTAYAAGYFTNVIPYLSDIAQDIFPVGGYQPTEIVEPEIPPDTAGSDYSDELETNILGTPFDLTSLASNFGVSRGPLTAFLYYGCVAFALIMIARKMGSYKPVMMIGGFLMIIGSFVGVPLVVAILGGLAGLFMIGFAIFYKPSTA